MGKAVIKSHLGAGLYRVGVQFDNASIQSRLAAIATQLTDITTDLATISAKVAAKKAEFDTAKQDLNNYINTTSPEDIAADPSQLIALTAQTYKIKGDYDILLADERRMKLRKTSLEKDQGYLQNNCPDEIETDAWCVALNENLAGTTATIEVDYALHRDGSTITDDTGVWIPATTQQTTPTAPTTILQHAAAGSPHSVWFNLGILPAAQRDSMLYRVGTISNLNKTAATCTITYDGQYNIPEFDNKLVSDSPIYPVLQNVVSATIEYPPCDGEAFENGDRVIVKSGDIVIGFYSNPRACPYIPPTFYEYYQLVGTPIYYKDEIFDPATGGYSTDLSFEYPYLSLTEFVCAGNGLAFPHVIVSYPKTFIINVPYRDYQCRMTQSPVAGGNPDGLIQFYLNVFIDDVLLYPEIYLVTMTIGGAWSDGLYNHTPISYGVYSEAGTTAARLKVLATPI